MLSSQGASVKTKAGFLVKQTIAQQSVIGNFATSKFIIGQGFQQSNKIKALPILIPNVAIETITYPNPFIDKVNFKFSSPIDGIITILLFDSLGRLVYSTKKYSEDSILTIDNLFLATGQYFAKLTTTNYTYTVNLLKTK